MNGDKITLGEIAEIVMGQSPSGELCNIDGDGTPLLNGPTEFEFKYPKPVQYTTDPKKFANKNDLLFCVRGSTTGRMNFADQRYAIGRGLAAIRGKNGFPTTFVKGVIDDNLPSLLAVATGSTFPNVSRNLLAEMSAPNFTVNQAISIAEILSALDEKIELNLEMNRTLEKIAQATFKHWFVDFQFPGFDGELVDGLPKGWKYGKLGDVCVRITKGTTPKNFENKTSDEAINYIKVESIDDFGNFNLNKISYINNETNNLLKRSIVVENDILFTIAGTLGRTAKVDNSVLPANTNQAVAIIRVNEELISPTFIFRLVKSDDFKRDILGKSVHAVQANLSLTVLAESEINIPHKSVLSQYNASFVSIENKMLANTLENRILTQIRDNLLPKLMSGKIRVTE